MTLRIFISYRRDDDCGLAAGWLADMLRARHWEVFMDLKIAPGANWRKIIEGAVSDCNLMLVAMGSKWAELLEAKQKSNARDWVRSEISVALQRDIPVVPILIGVGTQIPVLTGFKDICDMMDREGRMLDPSSAKLFAAQAEQFVRELEEHYGDPASASKSPLPTTALGGLPLGKWRVEKWVNSRGENRSGFLHVLKKLTTNQYHGVMYITPEANPKNQVEQEVTITVNGTVVTMEGKVVKGNWIDDQFRFQLFDDQLVGGCIDSDGVSGEIVLRKLDS
jgi:hypothetical protein